MRFFILIVFLIGFVAAIEADLNCPDDIYSEEEFECEVEIEDGDGNYDLKIEIDGERDSVLRIFDEDSGWKSGYYYVNDFVKRSGNVKLMIMEKGKYDVVLKLRNGNYRKEFDVGRISVLEAREAREEEEEAEEVKNDSQAVYDVDSSKDNNDIIFLSEDETPEDLDEEWDYVSKDGKIVDWLMFVFCLFLICLIGVLIWDRV